MGQRDRWAGSSRATVPCALETGPCTTGRPRPGDGQWGLVVIEELSLKLSPLLSVLVSQASLPSTLRVHPMTPSLGVTPDEAQLPAGPLTHWGGHIWAVPSPVGWAIWGADLGSGAP